MKSRRKSRRRSHTESDLTLHDLPRIQPKLSMFSQNDCLRIHSASLDILHRTGVEVYCPPALELLKKAGAAVEDNLVKIPPSPVEWALASVPDQFNLYRRGSEEAAIVLDGRSCYFGPGSDTFRYLDPRSGERRNFKLADVAACARLCDALPEINFLMSMGVPRDVPDDRYFWHQYATLLQNTTKPIVVVCDTLADLEAITAMFSAVAGGMDHLSQFPNMLLYSEPTSPLKHAQSATEKLLFCARNRIPITHSPAPMIGGTAPITLAGAVALGNAEVLSSLVMHQLQQAGAPFLYGHGVHHLDMKTMISVYGAPEFQLARLMAAEMGRFYHLPVWGYAGHTDSKVVDGQAAADAQFSVMTALLAGTNLNHDVGYLEAGLATSPELIVLTNELIGMTRRFINGVRLDDESLALDVIHEVGPGGEFLSHDHTMAHWRDYWLPQNFDRQRLESWQEGGSVSINGRLREQAAALMDEHQVPPLPATTLKEIKQLLTS
ncbi:MAG: trimethylamine methyltransferase family protein [Candidatus Promineifilaceae bacterium]